MRYIFCVLFVFTSILFSGQKKANDSLAQIILKNNTFKKNPYSKKYKLISDFVTFKNNSLEIAKVFTENGWGIMKKDGTELIPTQYRNVEYSENNHFIFGFYKKPEKDLLYRTIYNIEGKKLLDEDCQYTSNYFSNQLMNSPVIVFNKDCKLGLMDYMGNAIIPPVYSEIISLGKFLFCQDYPNSVTKVFDVQGNFTKTISSINIQSFGNEDVVQVIDLEERRYLLSLETLEPVTDKFMWGQFRDYSDHPDFYIEHYDYYNNDNTHILNKKFKEINSVEYPGSEVFCDKFLISKKNDSAFIFNNYGKIVAKYSNKDFDFFIKFAKCKLDEPVFFNKKKNDYNKFKQVDILGMLPNHNALRVFNLQKNRTEGVVFDM